MYCSDYHSDVLTVFCHVQILSVQPVSGDVGISVRRHRRSSGDSAEQLDILLAVRKTESRYFRSNALKRRIESVSSALEQQAGVHIVQVFNSVCNRDTCTGDGVSSGIMDCVTVVSLDSDALLTVVGERESFVSPRHRLTAKCVCRPGMSLDTWISWNIE